MSAKIQSQLAVRKDVVGSGEMAGAMSPIEITPVQFLDKLTELGDQAVKEKWSDDYLTERMSALAKRNPSAADALFFPQSREVILSEVVPAFTNRGDLPNPKETDKKEGFLSCLGDEAISLLPQAASCASALATSIQSRGKGLKKTFVECAPVLAEIVQCAVNSRDVGK